MSESNETKVPIRLSVSGAGEVIAAMQKTAAEAKKAWRDSLPEPKFFDTFDAASSKAAGHVAQAGKIIQTNWSGIAKEASLAAASMREVETAAKLSYSSIAQKGVKLSSTSKNAADLSSIIRAMPSIAAQLGLSELGFGVERLQVMLRTLRAIASIGLANIAKTVLAAAAPFAAATVGIGLGAIPSVYAGWAMWKTGKTKEETMASREENNVKILTDLQKIIANETKEGRLRGEPAAELAAMVKTLQDEQFKARKQSDPVRNAIGESVSEQIGQVLRRTREIAQASYDTEQDGAEKHMEALAALATDRMESERSILKAGLERILSDRMLTEEEQIAASEKYAERQRGIAVEMAAADREVLAQRETWAKAALGRAGVDPEERAELLNDLQAIQDEQTLQVQRSELEMESIEIESLTRVENIKTQHAERELAFREKLRAQKEKATEDDIREARRAERDAEKLLRLRQDELAARLAAVNNDYRLTGAQKYDQSAGLIQDGFDNGTIGDADASALMSRLGPNPNNLREQMVSTMADIATAFGTIAQQIASGFRNVIGTAVGSLTDAITGLILRTKSWADALREVGTAILTSVVRAIVQMGVQWAVGFAIQKTLGKAAAKSSIAEAASVAGAWGAAATAASIATMGTAAGVGLASAIAAMVTGSGAAVGISAGAGSFMDGGFTGQGPRNQVAGIVHRGEYVLDAMTVQRIGLPTLESMRADTSGASAASQPGGGASGSVNFAAFDSRADAERWANSQSGEKWFVDMAKRTAHRWKGGA